LCEILELFGRWKWIRHSGRFEMVGYRTPNLAVDSDLSDQVSAVVRDSDSWSVYVGPVGSFVGNWIVKDEVGNGSRDIGIRIIGGRGCRIGLG
jgi:hypothetical protein